MFPLSGKSFPQSAEILRQSIQTALGELLAFRNKDSAVTVDAPAYPQVIRLEVDLSGAKVIAKELPPSPKPVGERERGIEVQRLDVIGRPIQYESSNVNVAVTGRKVVFDFARNAQGNALLVLADAAEGNVDVGVAKADLQSLALAAASLAAKDHGVTIQDVDVELQPAGERAVVANVRVKAKKMLSGVVFVTGRFEVDDQLNATISDLSCAGEGMIGNLVAGFVQPKLKAYNGKKIALMAFSLGDLALRDLKIDVTDGLHVTAAFGK